jgi:acyl carrier protein
MTIASRTPEGEPRECPLCGALILVEPSRTPGDAPCPHCGHLVWFLPTSTGIRCYDANKISSLWERVREIVSEKLGINQGQLELSSSFLDDIGADSLDFVELVMDLEAEFDIAIPEADAEKMKTIADLLDYIERHRRERNDERRHSG